LLIVGANWKEERSFSSLSLSLPLFLSTTWKLDLLCLPSLNCPHTIPLPSLISVAPATVLCPYMCTMYLLSACVLHTPSPLFGSCNRSTTSLLLSYWISIVGVLFLPIKALRFRYSVHKAYFVGYLPRWTSRLCSS
jgi:hypothetical protein